MIVNMEGKIPEEASLRLSIQHIFRCVNPAFWSLSVREDWQNWPKLTQDIFHGWIQFMCGFLCCILLLKASESKVLLCDLRPDVRELVTTDTCEIKREVRLNAELKASIGSTCAACCWWWLSCLAHTCLMTGLPMCWRNTPCNGTSGDQRSSHHHLWSDQCHIFVERYLLRF